MVDNSEKITRIILKADEQQKNGNYSGAIELCLQALKLQQTESKELTAYKYMADINCMIALLFQKEGNYRSALKYYDEALNNCDSAQAGQEYKRSEIYNKKAGLYFEQGIYASALKNYLKALHFLEMISMPDSISLASTHNNIAMVYSEQGEYDHALEHYKKALEIIQYTKSDSTDIATTYNNMARVYSDQGDYDRALAYYEKALSIIEIPLSRVRRKESSSSLITLVMSCC